MQTIPADSGVVGTIAIRKVDGAGGGRHHVAGLMDSYLQRRYADVVPVVHRSTSSEGRHDAVLVHPFEGVIAKVVEVDVSKAIGRNRFREIKRGVDGQRPSGEVTQPLPQYWSIPAKFEMVPSGVILRTIGSLYRATYILSLGLKVMPNELPRLADVAGPLLCPLYPAPWPLPA